MNVQPHPNSRGKAGHRPQPGLTAAVRRWAEPALVLVAVALLVYFLARPAVPPQLDPAGSRYRPDGLPLTFNGVKPGDSVQATEARLGPPTFRNPSARYQQWEQPLTQIRYDQRGVIVEVGGSGAGVLCQGDRELIRCGEPEEAVARAFGKGEAVDQLYRYPVTPYPGIGWVTVVEIFCGSQSGSKRWVSHLQLTVPGKDSK